MNYSLVPLFALFTIEVYVMQCKIERNDISIYQQSHESIYQANI